MIVLHALAETVPPDHTGVDPDRRTSQLEGRGEDYDAAMAALREQVPDGMRLIWVRRPGADDPS
ncbi:hypothetical protein [Cellulomonas sp. Y8]|uniref:hypothetical protein n=1 Tax=Cellulomonas sp. Y8 TaxID=2591145 RepID=UPI0011C7697A|nr:hypothetical protein [Cellulomonas sp. Y8]